MKATPKKKHEQNKSQPPASSRRPYSPPRLKLYGNIRELTLGGSPGIGESGGGQTFKRR